MQSKPSNHALEWFRTLAGERIITQSVSLPGIVDNEITWDILRTDLIHPVCSGNKFFKLQYYIEQAIRDKHAVIETFGGAWSNHIVATAFAARASGLKAIGYIRGEEPKLWSQTLLDAQQYNMELVFLPRHEFDKRNQASHLPPPTSNLQPSSSNLQPPTSNLIPMGGYGTLGAKGASEILNYAQPKQYTHIFCAVGTGTMLAGLAMSKGNAQLTGITVVRSESLEQEIRNLFPAASFLLNNDYQFGGYAKYNDELIEFMNVFHEQNSIPTDFVYTGKLMYAIRDMLIKRQIPPGSRILAIHSGGLQGNKSLKNGRLRF